jgi:peptidoglycan DL-endopeptidase CwlO
MGRGWRQWAAVGCLRLAVLVSVGAVAAAMASDASAIRAAVTPTTKTTMLSAALAGLQTRAEVLTERYDQEMSLERQAAAAYRVTAARLTAARAAEQRASTLFAQQAVADYEADGGPSAAAAMFAGVTDPQDYLGALGIQQVMDAQRVDLLAASQSGEIVTRLFEKQAAALLARERAEAQAADFLKLAVEAAVNRQLFAVRVAKASRSRPAVGLPGARASEAKLGPLSPAVLAGGPSGAAPGVVAPDWSPDAGASVARGDAADPATIHHVGIYIGGGQMVDAPYTGAFVRIDSINAYPGLIGATRPAALRSVRLRRPLVT